MPDEEDYRPHQLMRFLRDALYSAQLIRDHEAQKPGGDPRTVAIVITHVEDAILRLSKLTGRNPLKDD